MVAHWHFKVAWEITFALCVKRKSTYNVSIYLQIVMERYTFQKRATRLAKSTLRWTGMKLTLMNWGIVQIFQLASRVGTKRCFKLDFTFFRRPCEKNASYICIVLYMCMYCIHCNNLQNYVVPEEYPMKPVLPPLILERILPVPARFSLGERILILLEQVLPEADRMCGSAARWPQTQRCQMPESGGG